MSAGRTTQPPEGASQAPSEHADLSARQMPLLLLLFVGSGTAALIYQVVWFQMLSLIIGSSAISLGVLLATFMGGMCIGSVGLSYVISPQRHPLRVYALLEAGIAVSGLIVLLALPWVGGLYTSIGGGGIGGFVTRSLLSALCLLPPTILMGATLPAIARWVGATPRGVSWLGFFYASNIAGAVCGALLAGFYLLRVFDVSIATFAAVAINLVVAGVGLLLAMRTSYTPSAESAVDAPRTLVDMVPPGTWPVFLTIGLSGMAALGAEVVWTRLLSLMLGGTTYTFSLILAAFLIGLGIGSSAGAYIARSTPNPRTALGWCQVLVMAGVAWAAWSLTSAIPYWPINPQLASSPSFLFQIDFNRALWTVLPAAIFWGASFPLALAAVASASKRQDPGHLVGGVYAANTIGAIVGALIFALVIIGGFGTQTAQRTLLAIAALGALVMLAPAWKENRPTIGGGGLLRAVGIIALAVLLAGAVAPVPGVLIAYGRYAATWVGHHGEILFTGEGTHSSMAVSRQADGKLNYHNAGKVQASSLPQDMRLQRMLGHFTTLIPENPRHVLVIGFGAGVTAGSVSIDPRVERLTIAEIERMVPDFVGRHFGDANEGVRDNPKTHLAIDDARHFLLTTDETFDAITSDPFDPWVKGAATLYTREFFELMKRKLNPGGVVTVFVQLYEAGEEAVKSEIATFTEVFPNATIWANTYQGTGYDVVLLGQAEPTTIDIAKWEERLAEPGYADVRRSLAEIGIVELDDLFATYIGRGPELQPWLADAQINRDRNLRLQYLAGLGINRYEQAQIHQQMTEFLTFPANLFVAPPERLDYLRLRVLGPR